MQLHIRKRKKFPSNISVIKNQFLNCLSTRTHIGIKVTNFFSFQNFNRGRKKMSLGKRQFKDKRKNVLSWGIKIIILRLKLSRITMSTTCLNSKLNLSNVVTGITQKFTTYTMVYVKG
jgi:hypothetical protein